MAEEMKFLSGLPLFLVVSTEGPSARRRSRCRMVGALLQHSPTFNVCRLL